MKTFGSEFTYGWNQNIRHGTTQSVNMTNVPPTMFTFPYAGEHLVKMYDPKLNAFVFGFTDNPYIVKLHMDFDTNPEWWNKWRSSVSFNFNNCVNLTDVYLRIPPRKDTDDFILNFLCGTNVTRFVCVYPEAFTTIDWNQLRYAVITNDLSFPRVRTVRDNFCS